MPTPIWANDVVDMTVDMANTTRADNNLRREGIIRMCFLSPITLFLPGAAHLLRARWIDGQNFLKETSSANLFFDLKIHCELINRNVGSQSKIAVLLKFSRFLCRI